MKNDNYAVTEIDRQHMARELFDQLSTHGNIWLAVRTDGVGWEIVKPRTQEAILAACATDAAINEAVQKERAGIVAWLRADADLTEFEAVKIVKNSMGDPRKNAAEWAMLVRVKRGLADALERGDHAAIEAHKESQHG